jgi:predicted deacylase
MNPTTRSTISQGMKTAITLGVLAVLVVAGAGWGWSALTKPLPKLSTTGCALTSVSKGSTVTPEQVTVSVLNAGKRIGLAGSTMAGLIDQGFHEGDSDNAPADTSVQHAQIWTDNADSPAVALLSTWVQPVEVVEKKTDLAGVVLVIGDGFQTLGQGQASVTADKDSVICSPPS